MSDNETRRVEIDESSMAVPQAGGGPLDLLIPWVIEFRIMGTAQVMQVKVTDQMVIGRLTGNEVAGPDIDLSPYNAHYLGVSRQHAVISARNSRVTIRDLGSSNGTFINGGRLPPNQEYRIRHGDRLTFGKLMVQVSFVLVPSSSERDETPFADITIPIMGSGEQVLLLDDDERMASTIAYVLEQAGFNVMMAQTVTDALSLMDHMVPAIIIMELMLPDRSGLELVEYVRSHEEGQSLPILVVSSVSGGYQMGQAIDAGVDVFLSKPVGVDELLRGLSKVLAETR